MRIFRDWNFSIALIFMFLIGIILLATMALVTPFIQNLMGYPVLASGYLLGTRGIGTFFAMMIVGRLSGKVDPRLLVFFGLTLATYTLYEMVGWTPDVPARTVAIDSIGQGVGLGFVFVPLNTIAFATLPVQLRTDGAALWTLIRNLGSSVGISLMIASLTNDMTTFHSELAEFINPFNPGLHMPDVVGKISTVGQGAGGDRGDGDAAGGGHRLFQRVPDDDLRLAGGLPAAGADPRLPPPRRRAERGRGGACGDGLRA